MTGIVGLPDLKVEINPTGALWVDITDDLRLGDGVSCFRGRTDERSGPQAGTLSLTLNNPVADYTPGRTGGAHHPLKVKCPIRLKIIYLANPYYIWTGRVDSWEPAMLNGVRPVCKVQASDDLVMLQAVTLKRWETHCHLDALPAYLWPMCEPAGSVAAGNYASGAADIPLVAAGTCAFGSDALPIDSGTAVTMTAGTMTATGLTLTGNNGGIALLYKGSGAGVRDVAILRGPTSSLVLQVGATSISAVSTIALAQELATSGAVVVNDGLWHHLAASWDDTFQHVQVWLDGAIVATSAGLLTGTPGYTSMTVGSSVSAAFTLSHLAVYDSILDNTAVQLAKASVDGASGERSTTRFTRLARFGGIAANPPTSTGLSTMSKQLTLGRNLVDILVECADAENSSMQIDGIGGPSMQSRRDTYNLAAALTVTANDIGQDATFVVSAANVVNDVVGSRPGGPDIYQQNAASVASYGLHTAPMTLALDTAVQLEAFVQYAANANAEPAARTPDLTIDVWTKQATVSLFNMLNLDPGETISVTGLPATLPASSLLLTAQGFSDSFGKSGWSRKINTTPAGLRYVWALNDAGYGPLDTATILGV